MGKQNAIWILDYHILKALRLFYNRSSSALHKTAANNTMYVNLSTCPVSSEKSSFIIDGR